MENPVITDTSDQKTVWIIQHCSRTGCDVAIRSRPGEPEDVPVCRYCRAGTAYYAADRGGAAVVPS